MVGESIMENKNILIRLDRNTDDSDNDDETNHWLIFFQSFISARSVSSVFLFIIQLQGPRNVFQNQPLYHSSLSHHLFPAAPAFLLEFQNVLCR